MSEPTNTQLANFACVMIHGPGFDNMLRDMVKRIFDESPTIRERWLGRHAEFQQKADELGKLYPDEEQND